MDSKPPDVLTDQDGNIVLRKCSTEELVTNLLLRMAALEIRVNKLEKRLGRERAKDIE